MSSKRLLSFCLPILFFFTACGPGSPEEELKGIPEEPEVLSAPADYTGLISSYSAGILPRESSITVVLSDPVEGELSKGILDKLFRFEPALKGSVSLVDPVTIRFTPDEPLPSGQFYKAAFSLGALRDVAPELTSFEYNFSTIKQDLEIALDRVESQEGPDGSTLRVYGRLRTADAASPEKVEETLELKGDFYKLSWEHNEDRTVHSFFIEGIPRREEASEFRILWSGKPLAVERSGEETVPVPSKESFEYLSFRQTRSPQKTVQIAFSMPLDPSQEVAGLIRVDRSEELREAVIRDNRLILYMDDYAMGNRTLTVASSLRDVKGRLLGREVEFTLPASPEKPSAVFLSDGGVLPGAGQFILPLEAVSLRAVDVEIIRVYENNMVQFLQENRDIKGTRELNRVGTPVAFRTVSLEGRGADNLNVKNRFDLDLTSWIKREPGALYQVRLSFRRSQSLYPCGHEHGEEEDLPLNRSEWTGPSYGTIWDQYYYSDWRNRDNPCFNTYYARRTDKVNLMASNLGVIAKQSELGPVTVYVTDLLSTDPVPGALVRVFDYQQQEIGRSETDANGHAALSVQGVPFALQAEKAGMSSWIRMDRGNALSLSDFEIDGVGVQDGLRGFLYGERGVWRPGDEVHLSFILQDRLHTLPADHPVVLELIDPEGRMQHRAVSRQGVGGMYSFPLRLDEGAPTGFWTARAIVGEAVFPKTLRVETVKPNRLKIALDIPEGELASGRQLIPMNVRWLHGAIAGGLRTEVDMGLSARPTRFDGYDSYSFDDPTRSFYSPPQTVFSDRIDREGHADIPLQLSSQGKSAGFLQVNLQAKVFEEGGDFSITSQTLRYSPYESYVGIRPPAGDQRRGMLLTDEDHVLDLVSLSREGNPTEWSSLKVEMYKLDWKWWWDKSEEDLSRFISRSSSQVLKRETVPLKGGKGSWTFRINYPEWGRYLIRAVDPVSGHAAGRIVYIDWPGWAGAPQRGDSASRLSFYADKGEYRVGEKAAVTIPSAPGGRILVSLEDGTGVLNSWWVDSQEGKTLVEIPITPAMSPSVYVHASYLQPYGQEQNDLPIRMYGLIPLKVVDPETKLQPVIAMPSQLEPEKGVRIEVSEKTGKPMSYTLAVVDEGLLDLTNFATPDPWAAFFAKETLGVRTWDLYDDIIQALAGEFGTLLSLGGGDGGGPQPPQKANRFKPVVRFFGPFRLEAGAKGSHEFTMPLYVGSVRVMAVAAEEDAYGSAEKTVPVRSDLMVLGTMPRVLAPDEVIQIPVNVFSLSAGGGPVKVRVRAEGPLALTGSAEQTLVFTEPSDQYAYFEARTAKRTGAVFLTIEAEGGGKKATHKLELNVRPSNPPDTRFQSVLAEPGETVRMPLAPYGLEDQYSQVLEVSSRPPINLEQRLDYLIRYPHGCIEQTVSSVFPQLYLGRFVTLSPDRQVEVEDNLKKGINRLKRFQLAGGGFAYWPSRNQADSWGTSYALHFLLEAEKAGYHVPPEMKEDGLRYQKEAANLWQPGQRESSLNQAYRLYTLALGGSPDAAGMNRLRESSYLSGEARWKLAAAYLLAGRKDAAEELLRNQPRQVELQSRDSYGSALRNKALVLETLALAGKKRDARKAFEEISAELSSERWLSTQSTAYALVSLAAWMGRDKESALPAFRWDVTGGDGGEVEGESPFARVALPGRAGELSLRNQGKRTLYVNLVEKGVPLRGEDRDSSSKLDMSVRYRPKNPDQNFRSEAVASGTDFFMEVTVSNPPGNPARKDLALEQMLPPGWEIINSRLFGSGGEERSLPFDYQDIRDDRIYTYFDLDRGETKVFQVLLNASYRGSYYQPALRCQAMYDDSVSAVAAGRAVRVQ